MTKHKLEELAREWSKQFMGSPWYWHPDSFVGLEIQRTLISGFLAGRDAAAQIADDWSDRHDLRGPGEEIKELGTE